MYCTCENIMVVPNINISIYHNFKQLASTYTNCCGNYSFIVPKFNEYTIILKKDCNCIKHDLKVIDIEFIYVFGNKKSWINNPAFYINSLRL